MILQEAKRVVRVRPPLVICETRHGFICASAGVDASNTPERGTLVLLPLDPDASAARLREALRERTGRDVGVIVTDSFGRPWRRGTTDVAIGAAGVEVVRDLIGERDPTGYELHATGSRSRTRSPAPRSSSCGKLDRVPVAVVRGLDVRGDGSAPESSSRPRRICSARTDRERRDRAGERSCSASRATPSATSPCTPGRAARRC